MGKTQDTIDTISSISGLLTGIPIIGPIVQGIGSLFGMEAAGTDPYSQYKIQESLQKHQSDMNLRSMKVQQQYNEKNMQQQNSYNVQNMGLANLMQMEQNDNQRKNQEQLTMSTPSLTRKGLQQAGINPNSGNFGQAQQVSGSGAPSAPSVGLPSSSALGTGLGSVSPVAQFDSVASALSTVGQLGVLKEQARALRINNDREEHKDKYANYVMLIGDETDKFDVTADPDGGITLSPVDVTGSGNKFNLGDLEIRQIVDDLKTKKTFNESERAQAEFNTIIANYKKKNPEVIRSTAEISIEEYRKLSAVIEDLIASKNLKEEQKDLVFSQKELSDLEHKLRSNSNISEILDKIFDPDVDWKTKVVGLLTIFFNSFSSSFKIN